MAKKHHKKLQKYPDSFEKLAEELGNLTYDSLADFLELLSEKMAKDGLADRNRNRVKLATALENSATHLKEASKEIEEAWRICKPFMKEEE